MTMLCQKFVWTAGNCARFTAALSRAPVRILELGMLCFYSYAPVVHMKAKCDASCDVCRYYILEIISVSSAFVNSAIVAFTSDIAQNQSWAERIWIFILMSSALLM